MKNEIRCKHTYNTPKRKVLQQMKKKINFFFEKKHTCVFFNKMSKKVFFL